MSETSIPDYQFDQWREVFWQRPTDGRRYWVSLEKDLLGNWVLVREWSGPTSRKRGHKEKICDSYEQGLDDLAVVAKRRAQRGYKNMNASHDS